jgi:hypothetical protein
MPLSVRSPLLLLCAVLLLACEQSPPVSPLLLLALPAEAASEAVTLQFGVLEVGDEQRGQLELVNAGGAPVRVAGGRPLASVEAGQSAFTLEGAFPLELAPGGRAALWVRFAPRRAGASFEGGFELVTEDGQAGPQVLAFGQTAPRACALAFAEEALDFGTVDPFGSTHRTLVLRNEAAPGGHSCVVTARLEHPGDPRFRLENDTTQVRVEPGTRFAIELSVSPGWPLHSEALSGLELYLDGLPLARLALRAHFPDCLEATAEVLDFGTVDGCLPGPSLELPLEKRCAAQVTLDSVVVEDAATVPGQQLRCLSPDGCPQFLLPEAVTGPRVLADAPELLKVMYQPLVEAPALGRLRLRYRTGQQPFERVIALHGAAGFDDLWSHQWDTGPLPAKTDVLLVIDNGPTMGARAQALAARVLLLTDQLALGCGDHRVAVTWADTRPGSTEGRFVHPADEPSVVTLECGPCFPDRLKARATVVVDPDALATPLEAALRALTPPLVDTTNVELLRGEADLAVLIVTDRQDTSPLSAADYAQQLMAVKAAPQTTTVKIAGGFGDVAACGTQQDDGRLAQVAALTGGATVDLCAPDWGFFPDPPPAECGFRRQTFELGGQPLYLGALSVFVDGAPVPQLGPDGVPNWEYLPQPGAVRFTTAPGAGRLVQVDYLGSTCVPR